MNRTKLYYFINSRPMSCIFHVFAKLLAYGNLSSENVWTAQCCDQVIFSHVKSSRKSSLLKSSQVTSHFCPSQVKSQVNKIGDSSLTRVRVTDSSQQEWNSLAPSIHCQLVPQMNLHAPSSSLRLYSYDISEPSIPFYLFKILTTMSKCFILYFILSELNLHECHSNDKSFSWHKGEFWYLRRPSNWGAVLLFSPKFCPYQSYYRPSQSHATF